MARNFLSTGKTAANNPRIALGWQAVANSAAQLKYPQICN